MWSQGFVSIQFLLPNNNISYSFGVSKCPQRFYTSALNLKKKAEMNDMYGHKNIEVERSRTICVYLWLPDCIDIMQEEPVLTPDSTAGGMNI